MADQDTARASPAPIMPLSTFTQTFISRPQFSHGATWFISRMLGALDEPPLDTECADPCLMYCARPCRSLASRFSGVGPDVDVVAPGGSVPSGRCILAAAAGSLGSTPCFLNVSRFCAFMACADGSLTDSQSLTEPSHFFLSPLAVVVEEEEECLSALARKAW